MKQIRQIICVTQVIISIIVLIPLFAVSMSCERQSDSRLVDIAGFVSDNPKRALDCLEAIDNNGLSELDRHYYNFLTIKANDKMYIKHESDSMILDLINYYSTRESGPLYPEVLYYGGRVYSDLGDYPTALQYFQKALDQTDRVSGTSDIRSRLFSQIGGLLRKLRLYKEAIPYLSEMLRQKEEDNDSVGIVYAQQGIGTLYYNLGVLEASDSTQNLYLQYADSILGRSLDYAESLPESFEIDSKIILSGVKQEQGDIENALRLIRHIPEKSDSIQRNTALAYASDIYWEASILDTAYMYAHELITSHNPSNKKTGYSIILSPEFRSMLHPDTLSRYYSEYKEVLEAYFDDNPKEQALIQESMYNYQTHERKSIKVQDEKKVLLWVIIGFAFLVIIMAFVILYLKYKNRNNLVKMREKLDNLQILKQEISQATAPDGTCEGGQIVPFLMTTMSEQALRQQLKEELMALYNQNNDVVTLQAILESEVYAHLQQLLKERKPVGDALWDKLEETVVAASPRFISSLRLLTGDRLTTRDRHTALLVKCGFRPVDLSILLALTNGAIVSRRQKLADKVFEQKVNVKVIDGIVRLL